MRPDEVKTSPIGEAMMKHNVNLDREPKLAEANDSKQEP